MRCDVNQAVAGQAADLASAADPVVLVVLSRFQVDELDAAARRHQIALGALVAVAAVMVADVENLLGRDLAAELARAEVEGLDSVVDDARVEGPVAGAPDGAELGIGVDVGPDVVAYDEDAGRGAVAPAAVGVAPHRLPVLGVEGVERTRHGVVGVMGVGLRLGQQDHAVVIDHHGEQKLVHAGEAEAADRVVGQRGSIDPPESLARFGGEAFDRFGGEQEDLAVAGGQLEPAEGVLAAAGANGGQRPGFPEHASGVGIHRRDVLARRVPGRVVLFDDRRPGLLGRIDGDDQPAVADEDFVGTCGLLIDSLDGAGCRVQGRYGRGGPERDVDRLAHGHQPLA